MDPSTLKFAETHEWAHLDGDLVTVGLSQFAVEQLSDLVLVDLPKVGARATSGKRLGEIESVKNVSDIYAPVSGVVAEVNQAVVDDISALSGSSAYDSGWLIKIRADDASSLDGLLSHDAYQAMIAEH